ncbi:MAG: hypothetical protein EG823_02030 [Actinobacteria bacterium]|nr:hypothetical protein [Actinomycetota bacterium]
MEDSTGTPNSSNRSVVMVLVVIVALLAAAVAYFAFAGTNKTDSATSDSTTGEVTGTTGMTGTTGTTPFDPATATKVPEGETPEQYVTVYFDAVVAGDYQTAYDRLPADKKAAQDEASFAEQLTGYGVTSFRIDQVVEEGEETKVTATATMPGGDFQYLWTFVKDGDGWLVKSRTLPGMGQ